MSCGLSFGPISYLTFIIEKKKKNSVKPSSRGVESWAGGSMTDNFLCFISFFFFLFLTTTTIVNA